MQIYCISTQPVYSLSIQIFLDIYVHMYGCVFIYKVGFNYTGNVTDVFTAFL